MTSNLKKPTNWRFKDLEGKSFGRLAVTSFAGIMGKNTMWNVLCVCGNRHQVASRSLCCGETRSCGCLQRETITAMKTKHGQAGKTSEYRSWTAMRNRCNNKNDSEFHNYGGRGISVCERWEIFESFLQDMGEKPTKSHTVDRINTNGNYEPPNCRWATKIQQGQNRRGNKLLTCKGETKCVAAWARELKVRPSTLYSRIKRGWTDEMVIETPIKGML